MTEWFRCYLPPCEGERRTDTTWRRHYGAAHHGTPARAVNRQGKTDVLPASVPRGFQNPPPMTGRAMFLAEREAMRQARA